MRLTKSAVDLMTFAGAAPKSKDIRWDDQVPGFGIRIWPSGAKTFVFKYRLGGRQRYLTLGEYGALTPDQARKLATLRRGDVLRGIDPLGEKQRLARGETVADLAKAYIERHAKPRNKTWEKDQERLDRYVLPAFGTTKVAAVTSHDVARLHHKIGAQKNAKGEPKMTTANRVLALLSSMFSRATRWGFLPENAANPAVRIERFPEVKRHRFVTKTEMPRLAAAIDAEPNFYLKGLIWLYLFTGMRQSELRTLRWDAIDFTTGEITLIDTKGGRPLYLPISAPARAILEKLPRERGNPHVFPGLKPGRPLVNVKDAWERIRTRANLRDVRLHDLRRTVGSWIAQAGGSLALIGRVLNHAKVETTAIYARFDQELVADTLEAHAAKVLELSAQPAPALPEVEAAVSAEVD